jgi:hypothetical protein
LLIDSAPIVYCLEIHPACAALFRPLFTAHAAGALRLAVTTLSIAEVLSGPLQAGQETLARRYRSVPESWRSCR